MIEGASIETSLFEAPIVPARLTVTQKPQPRTMPKGDKGSMFYPLSERVQDAIKTFGLADAARLYARSGIKVQEFMILAGPLVRMPRQK